MARMSRSERRDAIVDAALAVARRKGLGSTTVRDVAAEMGSSSGLIHHYFDSMDDVIAAAFERVAGEDLRQTEAMLEAAGEPRAVVAAFLRSYAPVGEDWAFQLWLDAWSEAARRPVLREASARLNLGWEALLERAIRAGVADGSFRSADPVGAAWRILSVVDGLALQVVAHQTIVDRADMLAWAAAAAEGELGLRAGALRRACPGRSGHVWLDRRRAEGDEEQGDSGEHEEVRRDGARAHVGPLEHDLAQRVDRVADRHDLGDRLQDVGQPVDGPQDAAEQDLGDDDDRDELDDLELGPGEGRQEDPEVDRADREQDRDEERHDRAAGGMDVQPERPLPDRADRRDADPAEHEERQDEDLDRGEEPEPERVAEDDLGPRHGRREQALQRPADPLP